MFVSPFIKNATKMVMHTRCFRNELGFAGTLHIPRDVSGKKFLQMSSMLCTLLHHWTALDPAYWAVYAPSGFGLLGCLCSFFDPTFDWPCVVQFVDVEAGDLCVLWLRYLKSCEGQTVWAQNWGDTEWRLPQCICLSMCGMWWRVRGKGSGWWLSNLGCILLLRLCLLCISVRKVGAQPPA